jgi:hypothetical protein
MDQADLLSSAVRLCSVGRSSWYGRDSLRLGRIEREDFPVL